MEKRRVGTRFIDREATEEDQAKPLMQVLAEKGIKCSIIWHNHILSQYSCDTYFHSWVQLVPKSSNIRVSKNIMVMRFRSKNKSVAEISSHSFLTLDHIITKFVSKFEYFTLSRNKYCKSQMGHLFEYRGQSIRVLLLFSSIRCKSDLECLPILVDICLRYILNVPRRWRQWVPIHHFLE